MSLGNPIIYVKMPSGASLSSIRAWGDQMRGCDCDCHKGRTMTTGIELIAAERQRQIEAEGWTPEHDAEHADGSLARAAACYAVPDAHLRWPWSDNWWKPTPEDRRRELVKAGALIAAEIDRLARG